MPIIIQLHMEKKKLYLVFVFQSFPMPKCFISVELFASPNMFFSHKFITFSKIVLLIFYFSKFIIF